MCRTLGPVADVPADRPVAVPAVVADAIEATAFSGAVRVDQGGATAVALARGFADRAHGVPNRIDTRFAIASGTKGFTALVVMSLVVDGVLRAVDTPARSVLGDDLPLVGDDVTVEHLLAHRSGIGDYLDEDAMASITDYVLPVPAHRLDTTEALPGACSTATRDGVAPGARFTYCNSGYVSPRPARRAGRRRAVPRAGPAAGGEPAGLTVTGFLRSDELPGDAAIGYLDAARAARTNVFHLPVLGSGDGGIYSTVADVHRLWRALDAGRIVPPERVAAMTRPAQHGRRPGRALRARLLAPARCRGHARGVRRWGLVPYRCTTPPAA